MIDFQRMFLQTQAELENYISTLPPFSYLALDLETANWWKPQEEKIALLQLAYRHPIKSIDVVLLDVQMMDSLRPVQSILEDPKIAVAIHNASFDAVKLRNLFSIQTRSIFDTMRAARRAGAKKYSLASQIKEHFGVELDKTEQQSDWSQRPFSASQLDYAAKDAVYTLLLYERQCALGMVGAYELPMPNDRPLLVDWHQIKNPAPVKHTPTVSAAPNKAANIGLAALGVVVKKPHYYSPNSLVVAIGNERSGLAGWIVNVVLGEEVEIEEIEARLSIAGLIEQGLIRLDSFRRCEASPSGIEMWQASKPEQIP